MQLHPALKQLIFIIASILFAGLARAVEIEMVTVGNPGNAPDTQIMRDGTTGYGSVGYDFNIGKYEVTAGQYTEFLNAKAKSDPYGLYKALMWSNSYGCEILQSGSDGSFTYSVAAEYANRPVNFVSFLNAARFTNWLNNGQGNGDTEAGAYTLDGYNSSYGRTINKNAGAQWWIPSENEWYKAAYYDPNKINEGVGGYWLYPTKSDTVPMADVPPGGLNSANHNSAVGFATDVGAYTGSASSYGTFDQGGNVAEWSDTIVSDSARFSLGGAWLNYNVAYPDSLASNRRGSGIAFGPLATAPFIGFRVASVPILFGTIIAQFCWEANWNGRRERLAGRGRGRARSRENEAV
jgi:formylglycine-generating enzyme required for sulfatase activity